MFSVVMVTGYATSMQPGRREVTGKLARAMKKPMIFGNHQKLFLFLAYMTSIGKCVVYGNFVCMGQETVETL